MYQVSRRSIVSPEHLVCLQQTCSRRKRSPLRRRLPRGFAPQWQKIKRAPRNDQVCHREPCTTLGAGLAITPVASPAGAWQSRLKVLREVTPARIGFFDQSDLLAPWARLDLFLSGN